MDKFKEFGQSALETDRDNEFETEYFPGGLDPFGNKETTGRWTRDENLLFIRGLELYGKGWKKIASLVKTRTVVQIRTHAQKYFLKMSKARQSGDQAGHLPHGKGIVAGVSKKKHRARPVAMTPLLIPFAQPADSFSPHADPNNTLYHFLSPRIGTVLTKTSTLVTAAPTTEESPSAEHAPCRLITVERTKLDAEDRTPPHWYSKRENIESLLQIAESLDWTADVSNAVGDSYGRHSRSNTLSTTDTDSPCTSHSAQAAHTAFDVDFTAPLILQTSLYGPYYDTGITRTFSPDAGLASWAAGSTGTADSGAATAVQGAHAQGGLPPGAQMGFFEEVWLQRSQYEQYTYSHRRPFQPDFAVFDYYSAEMDGEHAVEF